MKNEDNGQIVAPNGVFTYTSILTSNQGSVKNINNVAAVGDENWYMVSQLDPSNQRATPFLNNVTDNIVYILKDRLLNFILTLLISIVLGVLITINKIKKDEIIYFSEYDAMTGIYI